jgi:hypothetical protein
MHKGMDYACKVLVSKPQERDLFMNLGVEGRTSVLEVRPSSVISVNYLDKLQEIK